MIAENEPLHVVVRVSHADDATPFGSVPVESVDVGGEVVARAITGSDGQAVLEIPADRWNQQLSVRVVGQPRSATVLSRDELNGAATAALNVAAGGKFARGSLALLADQLVATRRVRADDLASDLASPASDSLVRLLPAADRARMLTELGAALLRIPGDSTGEDHLVDPDALRDGHVTLVPLRDLPLGLDPGPKLPDPELTTKPGVGWDQFGWSLSDDQSYRDYLRSVLVLFIHQQKLGVGADPTTFEATVDRQLKRRFFQNFRTVDRKEKPLNHLLLPIVTAILTAPLGSGFGFGIAAASLPVQGTHTDREQLDALLALAPVSVQEFANRYRLPLTEPDSAVSTPVLLNTFTLSRALSDTAQGPIEPPENIIQPQLPGEQGKTILWMQVVGSAPFFLRYDEWLARQQPFFAENLFAVRTQVESVANGPWLTDQRKNFLTYHQGLATSSIAAYNGYFATMDEVHRSATYLLAYGAADAKLAEIVGAIDTKDFAKADRLANEAELLLRQARPDPRPGEDWQPEFWVGTTEPLSLARRRKAKVSTITELVGSGGANPLGGLERFYALGRPIDLWKDVFSFRRARDQATRLQIYQTAFLLPMLRAMIRSGRGDLPGAVDVLAGVTGFFIGTAMLGSAAGMANHPDILSASRVVAGRLRSTDELGDRPYTARLMYDDARNLELPYSLTPQLGSGHDVLTPVPPILHPLEERYARLVQGDALLEWAEALYRTDDASSLERARELYKAVVFLHGEDPGTSAYRPFQPAKPWFALVENPRRRNQLDRARLALHQLEAGLNFYGYSDDAVPTLSYDTLVGAAQRWATGAKTAQTDYLAYLGRVEQLDLDLLAAKAQERKARATVAITAEVIEIAKAGVVVAKKLVTDVEKLIAAKRAEINDANSLFSQFKDYFSGMKSSVSSMVDVGKSASEGYSSLSGSSAGDALGIGADGGAGGAGGGAGAGGEAAGLGSAAGGFAVLGGFAAFAVLSTITLQGMADAAMKRQGELTALQNEALPAAQAGVRVQERNVAIANLQAEIAATDLAYARDLVNYQNERFLNRDFWDALAGVARHALHRYLDLSGQAAWFAERALAYRLATTIRVVRIGYFDPRMRDIGGVDRLALDLAELEAMRLGAARLTVPLTRTYSLARDLPLAFGQLKASGRCTFALTDDDLIAAHPGTYAHRIRAVDVAVDAPGTVVPTRGMLTNGGFSLLRRAPGAPPVPLLRFADALPVSEFRMRSDMALYGMPGEQLMPFEGAGFTTTWTLELPPSANPHGLNRITDVRITFDVQAGYEVPTGAAVAVPQPKSRAMFVSALALAPSGLTMLRDTAKPVATLVFGLDRLAVPDGATITNVAVLLPGVAGGSVAASWAFAGGPKTSFTIDDGLALSNTGPLSDGNPANDQPLNAAAGGSPTRPVTLKVTKGGDAARLATARDAMLWIEYLLP